MQRHTLDTLFRQPLQYDLHDATSDALTAAVGGGNHVHNIPDLARQIARSRRVLVNHHAAAAHRHARGRNRQPAVKSPGRNSLSKVGCGRCIGDVQLRRIIEAHRLEHQPAQSHQVGNVGHGGLTDRDLVAHHPRAASRSASGISLMLMPTIGSPRLRLTSARISGAS